MNLLTAAGLVIFYKRVIQPLLEGLARFTIVAIRAALFPLLALTHVHARRAPAPPPFRGTNTLSGRPLRNFKESLDDLNRDMLQ